MASTVHELTHATIDQSKPTSSSGGGWGGTPSSGARLHLEDSSPASRTGVWVGLAAITMTFAAFTSAMIVRQGGSNDWQHFTLPSMLYVSTAVLLVSSAVLEVARSRVAAYIKHGQI